jgi:hypothetical protein
VISVIDMLESAVLPVMRLLLAEGELQLLEVGRASPERDLHVRVELPGDTFRINLWEKDGTLGAATHLFREFQDFLADRAFSWAEARPECPGHVHPAALRTSIQCLELYCPADGQRIRLL